MINFKTAQVFVHRQLKLEHTIDNFTPLTLD